MSQRVRHAERPRLNKNKLDKLGMLSRLARLRGSALRRTALGRAIVVLLLATTLSVAAAKETNNVTIEEKPLKQSYDVMNIKLYLHNQLNDWDQFECANQLGIRESNWRFDAINRSSGAYGIFQHMSEYAPNWDPYTQIDKHIEYIQSRYNGSWCKALKHLQDRGWH
jgi:hypothetical protein